MTFPAVSKGSKMRRIYRNARPLFLMRKTPKRPTWQKMNKRTGNRKNGLPFHFLLFHLASSSSAVQSCLRVEQTTASDVTARSFSHTHNLPRMTNSIVSCAGLMCRTQSGRLGWCVWGWVMARSYLYLANLIYGKNNQ